ncbi:HAMP domain-containing sensor histidine kinase [Clostridioides difficile]
MYKKRVLVFFVLFVVILMFCSYKVCLAGIDDNSDKKVLIIGSYSGGNEWEMSIIKGFEDKNNKYLIKVEFLDSKLLETKEYDESFVNLLNIKYKDSNIDYIVTLDDEAFQLIRENLFNEELFIYKKKIVFAGVNKYIALSKEESEYITGILEYQDNLPMINTILKSSRNINDIYLLLDKSIYCNTVGQEFSKLVNIADKPFNYHIIEGMYFDDIKEKCSQIPSNGTAIFLCGTYKDSKTNEILQPKKVIDGIKSLTNAPIYVKLEEYIYAGAVGGMVNDGYKLGGVLYSFLNNIISGNNVYTIVPTEDTFSIPIFNYDSIKKYNINPLKLPAHSVFINKKPYELLLPKYLILIIFVLILIAVVIVVSLIYLSLSNRKRAKESKVLLIESIQREKIKTDFIVTISHELRTPLNIIINAANLLKLRLNNNEVDSVFFNEKLDYIMKNSNRLRRYINNLIDVSKLEMGYMNTNFTNENIVSVIEDVTLTIVDLARSFNLEVIFDTEEEEIITAIDKLKIERVLLNLLSNAIKFTKEGGIIMVMVRRENDNVAIEISDNGIGMSEEIQKHVFEKFKRADLNEGLNRQNEGSGLGLFIVKGLIDLHNGEISLKSKLREGTKFIITLPIKLVKEEEQKALIGDSSLEYMFEMEFSDVDRKE